MFSGGQLVFSNGTCSPCCGENFPANCLNCANPSSLSPIVTLSNATTVPTAQFGGEQFTCCTGFNCAGVVNGTYTLAWSPLASGCCNWVYSGNWLCGGVNRPFTLQAVVIYGGASGVTFVDGTNPANCIPTTACAGGSGPPSSLAAHQTLILVALTNSGITGNTGFWAVETGQVACTASGISLPNCNFLTTGFFEICCLKSVACSISF